MDCSGDRPARSDGGLGLGAEEMLGQVRAAHGAAPATRALEASGGQGRNGANATRSGGVERGSGCVSSL